MNTKRVTLQIYTVLVPHTGGTNDCAKNGANPNALLATLIKNLISTRAAVSNVTVRCTDLVFSDTFPAW